MNHSSMFRRLISKVFPTLKQEVEANHYFFEDTKDVPENLDIQYNQNTADVSDLTFELNNTVHYQDRFFELLFNSAITTSQCDPINEFIESKILQLLRQPQYILKALPLVPSSLTQVMNTLNQAEFDVEILVNLISDDPVIAAKVIELANSAFYNRANKPISDIKAAFMLLGQKGLSEGVINGFVAQMVPKAQIYFKNYGKHLWSHSQTTGRLSQQLAIKYQINAEQAYLVGLLVNLGSMVIFQLMIDAFSSVCPDTQPNAQNIKRLVTDYGQRLTLDIAKLWNFPREILESLAVQNKISTEHELQQYFERYPIGGCVYQANQLAMLSLLVQHNKIELEDFDFNNATITLLTKEEASLLINHSVNAAI